MPRILIVEDDQAIADLIALNLELAGYQYVKVYDGTEAVNIIKDEIFDLVLLDVMIPGKDGFEVLQYIKPKQIPAIFLTAKNSLTDKVAGLKLGAEDYIAKPFEAMELLARIEVVLRRYHVLTNHTKDGFEIDETQRQVKKDGMPVDLTLKEFDLLLLLYKNRNKALSREKILEWVWGFEFMGETRTVDIHIQRLRKKLGWEDKIKTVFKFGYRLEDVL